MNGVGGGNGDANWFGGGNRNVNGDGDEDEAGTRTWVEANEGAQVGNKDGSENGTGAGMGTGVEIRRQTQDGDGDESGDGNEISSGDGNEDEDQNVEENEDGNGESEGEAKKHQKPPKSCRHDVVIGTALGLKRRKRRQERVGFVTADPDNLGNAKEAEEEAQGTQGLNKKYSSRETMSPLPRLIRGFCIKESLIPPRKNQCE